MFASQDTQVGRVPGTRFLALVLGEEDLGERSLTERVGVSFGNRSARMPWAKTAWENLWRGNPGSVRIGPDGVEVVKCHGPEISCGSYLSRVLKGGGSVTSILKRRPCRRISFRNQLNRDGWFSSNSSAGLKYTLGITCRKSMSSAPRRALSSHESRCFVQIAAHHDVVHDEDRIAAARERLQVT